jgi:hypothetical protein
MTLNMALARQRGEPVVGEGGAFLDLAIARLSGQAGSLSDGAGFAMDDFPEFPNFPTEHDGEGEGRG